MSGVYPVHGNTFKINTKGRTGVAGDLVIIKDLDTFSPNIDANVEEWFPLDQQGWSRSAVTSKKLVIGFSGKRNFGDPGNDYIGSTCLLATGQNLESEFEWVMPSGAKLNGNCVVNVSNDGGGESTEVGALEFEILADGKPTFTPSAGDLAPLTFVCTAGDVSGTQIESVSPSVTAGNSYMYKINGALPAYGEDLNGKGWVAYTLGTDIVSTVGNIIALVEVVTATKLARKGGTSPVITA